MTSRDSERGYNPEEKIWSFFDKYKTSGEGRAVDRPDIMSFSHVTAESKEKDSALVEKKKDKPNLRIQRETGSDAFAFENFLTTESMKNGWFGGEVVATTEYDDWVSGVDAVIEWPSDDGEPLRLAVDFTSAKQDRVFFKKSDKLNGDATVKYLRSSVEDGKEMRSRMPIVILGFDKSVFKQVATSGEAIGPDHPMKRLLLEQAFAQVKMQIQFSLVRVLCAPRARRARLDGEMKETISKLTDDSSTEELSRVYQDLGEQGRESVVAPKYQDRIERLLRLEKKLDGLTKEARESVQLNEAWSGLEQSSRTHHILAK